MSRGVNRVTIIGNLGDDPSMKYLPTGGAVCNFTVATSESWTDKQTNEKKTETEWHRVVVYQRLAEVCGEYLRKGSKVYLEGKLKTRKWQDQQGVERYTTEIIANEMQMLDGKQESQSSNGQATVKQSQQQPQQRQQPQQGFNQPQQTWQAPPQDHQRQMARQEYNQHPSPIDFDDQINF